MLGNHRKPDSVQQPFFRHPYPNPANSLWVNQIILQRTSQMLWSSWHLQEARLAGKHFILALIRRPQKVSKQSQWIKFIPNCCKTEELHVCFVIAECTFGLGAPLDSKWPSFTNDHTNHTIATSNAKDVCWTQIVKLWLTSMLEIDISWLTSDRVKCRNPPVGSNGHELQHCE